MAQTGIDPLGCLAFVPARDSLDGPAVVVLANGRLYGGMEAYELRMTRSRKKPSSTGLPPTSPRIRSIGQRSWEWHLIIVCWY